MSSAKLETVQELAKTLLAANSAFAGLGIFIELDETATPDQLAQIENDFDVALLSTGIAVIISEPELASLDKCHGASVSTAMAVTIAICENAEVNRGEADSTTSPPRNPAKKSRRKLLEAAIAALLPEFYFDSQIVGRSEWQAGFWVSYLVALRRHQIKAGS